MQVFKYVLQYLRARRDSEAFRMPNALSEDTADAIWDEAEFFGLPGLSKLLECAEDPQLPVEYEYDFQMRLTYDLCSWGIRDGWELVSANSMYGENNNLLVICRRPT